MPDLLTHVIFAYASLTLMSLRWQWIDGRYFTIGMAGAIIPDISKAYLLLDEETIESLLEMPFGWYGLHTLGGVVLITAMVCLWVDRAERFRVGALCLFGGLTHLFLDSFIANPSGFSYPVLWPLSYHRVPSPGLFISTDVWPLVLTIGLAAFARLCRERV